MYLKLLFFIIFILSVKLVFAQNEVRGKVIDADTKHGVVFASIIYLEDATKTGGYTDSLGNYKINFLDLAIQVSCIGYKTLKVKASFLLNNPVIELNPIIYTLNSVDFKPKKSIMMQLGYFKNKKYNKLIIDSRHVLMYRKFSNFIAQLIPNKQQDENLLITKLCYNLSNHFKKSDLVNEKMCEPTLLRVHLFEIDKFTNKPGKELLTKNVIFRNNCNSDNLIVDVSHENIYLPTNGVFVGLEFIDNSRTVVSSNYPFYVVENSTGNLNTYFSNHQEKWQFSQQYISTPTGIKITLGQNVQFGIEVAK